jgi:hypothetical protein
MVDWFLVGVFGAGFGIGALCWYAVLRIFRPEEVVAPRPVRRFRMDLSALGAGTVECDGRKLNGVRAVTVSCRVNEPTTVVLEYVQHGVEIDADGELDQAGPRRMIDVTRLDSQAQHIP